MANVEVDNIEGGITVGVTPRNPDARAFGWTDFPDEIILGIGDHGARWDLGAGPEDVALLQDIARSVIAGRVREVFAPGRSAVSVTLVDGSIETEIGGKAPIGCLPLPFWRRWSRSVHFLYFPPDAGLVRARGARADRDRPGPTGPGRAEAHAHRHRRPGRQGSQR